MPDLALHQLIFIPKTETDFKKRLKGKEVKGKAIFNYFLLEKTLTKVQTSVHWNEDVFDAETHVQVRLLSDAVIPAFKKQSFAKKFELKNFGPHMIYDGIMGKNKGKCSFNNLF